MFTFDFWFLIYDFWFLTCEFWILVSEFWFLISDFKYRVNYSLKIRYSIFINRKSELDYFHFVVFWILESGKRVGYKASWLKGHVCRSWLVDFEPFCFFSVFQGSLAVAIILIDGREKPNRQLAFELQSSHVIENRNNGRFYTRAAPYPSGRASSNIL